jgi:tetratricopeptide (TPR) repeat protein
MDAGHESLRNGDPQAAMMAYREVIALQPRHIGALGGVASAYSQQGMIEEAIGALRAAIAVAPRVAGFHVRLGQQLNKQSDWEGAEAAFVAALAIEPAHAGAHSGLGVVFNQIGKDREARSAVRAAIEMAPENAGYHAQLGHLLNKHMDWHGAVAAFQDALAIDSKHIGALLGRCTALERQDRIKEAIAALEVAVEAAPMRADLHEQLGYLHSRHGSLNEAVRSFETAVRLDPSRMSALVARLNLRRKYDEAIAVLRFAATLAPNNVNLRLQLGQSLEGHDDTKAATAEFRAALEIDKGNQGARAGLRRVRDPNIIFRLFDDLFENCNNHAAAEQLAGELEVPQDTLKTLLRFVSNPQTSDIDAIAQTLFEREVFQTIVRILERQNLWSVQGTLAPPERLQVAPMETDILSEEKSHAGWLPIQWLCSYLLRKTQIFARAAVVATMRDDGLSMLEWIAHYRVLGFDNIFIYSNDNADGSDGLLNHLASLGIITYIENRLDLTTCKNPQRKAFSHALNLLPELWEYEWALFVDSDEFLVPSERYNFRIGNLIDEVKDRFPDRAPSAICFNWLWFVSGNTYAFEPQLLLRRFQHTRDSRNMKSLVKLRDVYSMRRLHFPDIDPHGFLVRSDFTKLERTRRFAQEKPVYASGQLNHYWSKSFEEFSIKKARGDSVKASHDFDRDFKLFFGLNGEESAHNHVPPPEALIAEIELEIKRLEALPGVKDHLANIRSTYPKLLERFDGNGGLRAIFDEQVLGRS